MDAASQEADLIHDGRRRDHAALLDRQRRAGLRHDTAPSPNVGIQVGASTNFGSTGWDSIANYSQVTDNDVIEWSNRGPGANGRNGVDVVADGSYAPGDVDAQHRHRRQERVDDVGRHEPLDAGHGRRDRAGLPGLRAGARRPPRCTDRQDDPQVVGRTTSGYDNFTQGAGSIDAGRAVAAASGAGADDLSGRVAAGDDRGRGTRALPAHDRSGRHGDQVVHDRRPGTLTVSDRILAVRVRAALFTSASVTQESVSNFNAPDYLIDITNNIKAHPTPTSSSSARPTRTTSSTRTGTTSRIRRGVCSPTTGRTSTMTAVCGRRQRQRRRQPHGQVDQLEHRRVQRIDFRHSEMEQGEYERFFYHRPGSNILNGASSATPPSGWAAASSSASSTRRRTPRSTRPTSRSRSTTTRTSTGLGHRDETTGRQLSRPHRRPGGHAVRHVRGRGRGRTKRPPTIGRPGGRHGRADRRAGARTARSPAPHVRRHRRRRRAGGPAVQQRHDLRRQRLDVATGVGRLAVLLLQRREGVPTGRSSSPTRRGTTRRSPTWTRPVRADGSYHCWAARFLFGAVPFASLGTVGGSQNAYLG